MKSKKSGFIHYIEGFRKIEKAAHSILEKFALDNRLQLAQSIKFYDTVDKDVIENLKRYAKQHKTTLPRLITQMLARLPQEDEEALPPTVTRLLGVLPASADPSDYRAFQRTKRKL